MLMAMKFIDTSQSASKPTLPLSATSERWKGNSRPNSDSSCLTALKLKRDSPGRSSGPSSPLHHGFRVTGFSFRIQQTPIIRGSKKHGFFVGEFEGEISP